MLEYLSFLRIFLSLVLIGVVIVIRRLYWHPLSKFPGPALPALTSFYQFYIFWTHQEGNWYSKLHEKYGPVVRCGPNHLSFNDPSMVSTVYHSKVDKTGFHQEFSCPAAVFNKRYFSFDVITAMSVGTPVGFMDAKDDVRGLIRNMEETAVREQRLSLFPPISAFARNNPLGRRLFVSHPSDRRGLGLFMAEIRQEVQQRRACAAKPKYEHSMLDQWLASSSSDGQGIPQQEIEDELLMDMMAGPDSIALMATNLVFLVADQRPILQRAQAEVDAAYADGRLSGQVPTYDECRQLPFITACVNEGLRFVASTFPRRRASPPGRPFSLNGIHVPPGTSVSSSAAMIGRHPDLYGDQADQFLPDRWLAASPEQLQEWARLDVHWGVGVRKCLGKHVGLMALYKTLVMLIRSFDLQLEETTTIDQWSYPSSEHMLITPHVPPAQ
ncbi:hypothetical protein LCI18_003338 [Fusarium solani-melongenae]|uniref:Uncharacterized protein n=1 Tax=Fusarium solani subsp. cucurbitae TaxID=2747967 RepID=A0ACD3YX12_FUSSC|nr:hypothetical protein LCI18_003338 [Fusarium solani-melongenae]